MKKKKFKGYKESEIKSFEDIAKERLVKQLTKEINAKLINELFKI